MRDQGSSVAERDPFARLESTHRRLEERLQALTAAVAELARPDLPRDDRDEALAVIEETTSFFERGARRHVEDEERTLFPRLSGEASLAPILQALEAEHREHRALEDELSALVAAFEGRRPDLAEAQRLTAIADRLGVLYRAHIAREEQELFPAARKVLAPEVLAEMGDEMVDRRGDRGKGRR